jgi:hypothetical protein
MNVLMFLLNLITLARYNSVKSEFRLLLYRHTIYFLIELWITSWDLDKLQIYSISYLLFLFKVFWFFSFVKPNMQNANLKFVKVVDAYYRSCGSMGYCITLNANDGEKVNVYETDISVTPWYEWSEMLNLGEVRLIKP